MRETLWENKVSQSVDSFEGFFKGDGEDILTDPGRMNRSEHTSSGLGGRIF